MRKASLILLTVVLSVIVAAGFAFAAGVIGTPHDVAGQLGSISDQGACSACHIPHKSAGGDRLWAAGMTTTADTGAVGNLCSSCHEAGAGYSSVLPQAAGATNTVYNQLAHGFQAESNYYVNDSNGADDILATATNLPYYNVDPDDVADRGGVNWIQCTSCHNVHDNNANRPFLRRNIRDLCINCHLHRYHNGTAWQAGNVTLGTWGGGYGTANAGSHPVGTDVTGEMDTATPDSPIVPWTGTAPWAGISPNAPNAAPHVDGVQQDGNLMQLFDDTSSVARDFVPSDATQANYATWNLGLHVATGTDANGVPNGNGVAGGVVCVSCHAIHGVQDDSTATTGTQTGPNTNLLARYQQDMTISGSSVANGNTDPFNALCEMCHFSDPFDSTAFLTNVDINNDGVGGAYTPGSRPNPGATQYTHPMDDAPIVNTAVTGFPANWPQGSTSGAGYTDPRVICESCHVPHAYRNGVSWKNRGDTLSGQGDYILRDDVDDVCASCHDDDISGNHHPTSAGNGGQTMSFTGAVPGNGGNIGDGDNVLECNDCHQMTGAHNWSGPNAVGLDPNWEPYNNARGASDVIGGVVVNMSVTCEECHYRLYTGGTFAAITPTHTGANEWASEAQYQKTGSGTHFLGNTDLSVTDAAVRGYTQGIQPRGSNTTGFDPRSMGWGNNNPQSTNTNNAYSRWGSETGYTAAGEHLVCESCHELEPDKNDPESKLLLGFYQEDTDSTTTGDNQATSFFCEGCHGNNGPGNTHAMTGDSVSRRNNILSTSSPYLSGNAPTADPTYPANHATGYSTFPDTHEMSCDSCHQVHDANSISRTYILDAPEGNTTGGAGIARGGVAGNGSDHPVANTGFDYTGFCDQCHRYTVAN